MSVSRARPFLIVIVGMLLASCAHQPVTVAPAKPIRQATVTGVSACDNYLATYLQCHRAASVFPADQLQTHYQSMRESLSGDARDPAIRPALAQRCTVLTTQLKRALQGKSCAMAVPAHPSH